MHTNGADHGGNNDWVEGLQVEVLGLREERDRSQAALEAKDLEIQRIHEHYQDELKQQRKKYKNTIEGFEYEVDNLQHKFNEVTSLSDTRGRELAGAQTFLSTADAISLSEVVDKVTALNEEIFQAAAYLGDCVRCSSRRYNNLIPEDKDKAYRITKRILKDGLTGLLEHQRREDWPISFLLVQVTVQTLLVEDCRAAICSWYQSNSTVNKSLQEMYDNICTSEQQAVAGRWRALTRSQSSLSSDIWTERLMRGLEFILEFASWYIPEPDQQHSFQRHLEPVFRALQEVRIAIGEKITSTDLGIVVADVSGVFTASYMEDAHRDFRDRSNAEKDHPERILGTTAMGLTKISYSEEGQSRTLVGVPLLRPKVVLEAKFYEALKDDSARHRQRQDGRG